MGPRQGRCLCLPEQRLCASRGWDSAQHVQGSMSFQRERQIGMILMFPAHQHECTVLMQCSLLLGELSGLRDMTSVAAAFLASPLRGSVNIFRNDIALASMICGRCV